MEISGKKEETKEKEKNIISAIKYIKVFIVNIFKDKEKTVMLIKNKYLQLRMWMIKYI